MHPDVAAAVELLSSPRSPVRRSGAKRLRKLRAASASMDLQSALVRELKDSRTWETQYQLIMALGESGCCEALPLIDQLRQRPFEATIVYVAIGDAFVRLSATAANDASAVLSLLRTGSHPLLLDGAFRAMAMLQMRPPLAVVDEILSHFQSIEPEDPLRFWVAAAAPGWSGEAVEVFLQACESSSREDIREVAALARKGRYKKWRPL